MAKYLSDALIDRHYYASIIKVHRSGEIMEISKVNLEFLKQIYNDFEYIELYGELKYGMNGANWMNTGDPALMRAVKTTLSAVNFKAMVRMLSKNMAEGKTKDTKDTKDTEDTNGTNDTKNTNDTASPSLFTKKDIDNIMNELEDIHGAIAYKYFLKRIYSEPKYIDKYKKVKAGSNGANWTNDTGLMYAFTLYRRMSKMNTKMDNSVWPKTRVNYEPSHEHIGRCVAITKCNTRCTRPVKKGSIQQLCCQHDSFGTERFGIVSGGGRSTK